MNLGFQDPDSGDAYKKRGKRSKSKIGLITRGLARQQWDFSLSFLIQEVPDICETLATILRSYVMPSF